MKNNGNNLKTSNYYIGLDVGTDSLGWAVTDEKYNICKYFTVVVKCFHLSLR